jgi:Na+-driven multidrug efflux pump
MLALLLGLAATTMILAVAQTSLGGVVFHAMIPTTTRVSELARAVLTQLAPVPILVAVRDVALGLAIRERRTTLVAASTMVRIVVLSGVVAVVVLLGTGSGARAAAWALVSGIAVETWFVLARTHPAWRTRLRRRGRRPSGVSYGGIARIAAPLAVAAMAWTAVRPVVSAILGRLPDSELAQAGFGVVLPILMVSCSPLWGLHHVSLVLPKDRADLGRVIRFAAAVTAVVAAGIGVVTLTPLKLVVLRLGFGLSPEMERVVAPALCWMVLAPFFLTARAVAQGLLIKARRTGIMLVVSPIKLALMVAIGHAVVSRSPAPDGVTLAIALVMGGDLFDAVIFGLLARRLVDRGLIFQVRPRSMTAGLDWPAARPALGGDG